VFHEPEQRLAAIGIPHLIVECEAVDDLGVTGVHRYEPLAQTARPGGGVPHLARRRPASLCALSRSTTASAARSRGEPCGEQQVPDVTRAGRSRQHLESYGPPYTHSPRQAPYINAAPRPGGHSMRMRPQGHHRPSSRSTQDRPWAPPQEEPQRPRASDHGMKLYLWGVGVRGSSYRRRYPASPKRLHAPSSLHSPRWSMIVCPNNTQDSKLQQCAGLYLKSRGGHEPSSGPRPQQRGKRTEHSEALHAAVCDIRILIVEE
jgi:hypothetical protein